MTDLDPIYVNIPCPTKEEGIKLCTEMLKQNLCGTAKVIGDVNLLWSEDGIKNEQIVLINLKTTKENLPKIQEFIFKNHSWVTPCIEVVAIHRDMC